jgi:hypothetical protein
MVRDVWDVDRYGIWTATAEASSISFSLIFESEVSRCSMSMRSVFRRHSELIMWLSDSSNNRCDVPLTTDSEVSKYHSVR